MDRCDVVRAFYERFNHHDIEGALALCDQDFEFRDLFGNEGPALGRDAVRQRWIERFSNVVIKVTVGEVTEMGDDVLAAISCRVYDATGKLLGPNILVADRFSFRGQALLRMESTVVEEPSDEIKALVQPAMTGRGSHDDRAAERH